MVGVDVRPREVGGQVRQSGPGRQLVEELFEFDVGDRGRLARVESGSLNDLVVPRPGRILLDEPEDALLDRPTVAGRAFSEPPLKVVRQVNGEGHRDLRPELVSS